MLMKFLMHITTEESCRNILKMNKFIPSVHTNTSIQWLGDGIYFWSANDDDALRIGKALVKNKIGNRCKRIQKIILQISFDESKYMNLDNEYWEKKFFHYLNSTFPQGKELINLFIMLKRKKHVSTEEYNKIGKILGDAINLYLDILEQENNKTFDVVSYYFYMRSRKIYSFKKETYVRQFCIKNENLVNHISSKDWIVEYIV